jgi:hypothetical protein
VRAETHRLSGSSFADEFERDVCALRLIAFG